MLKNSSAKIGVSRQHRSRAMDPSFRRHHSGGLVTSGIAYRILTSYAPALRPAAVRRRCRRSDCHHARRRGRNEPLDGCCDRPEPLLRGLSGSSRTAASPVARCAAGALTRASCEWAHRRRSSRRPRTFSNWRHFAPSSAVSKVIERPARPIRAVRPTRWVNHSADSGSS